MLSFSFIRIFALAVFTHACLGHPTYPKGWSNLANITVAPRQEHTTFFLPPSTIGIIGGIVPEGGFIATTDLMQFYSITENTWETVAPMPRPLNHVNAAVSSGKIYVLGGLADADDGSRAWNAVRDSWVYDPKTNKWDAISPMPEGEERGSAAIGVYDGKIYLAGGMRTLQLEGERLQDTVDTVSIYDTRRERWITVPEGARKIPGGRDHAGAGVVGDKFYVLGGRDHGQNNVKDTVFILDLRNVQRGWVTSSARMPTPRGGVAAGVVGKHIYTFGGEGNQELESGVFDSTEVYNTATDSWERLAPMKVARHGTYAVGVGSNVYVPGGGLIQGGGDAVAYFDVFRP
jgi:N-acetylneuraminic acid mutarotase